VFEIGILLWTLCSIHGHQRCPCSGLSWQLYIYFGPVEASVTSLGVVLVFSHDLREGLAKCAVDIM
jgi:hypothetical protein